MTDRQELIDEFINQPREAHAVGVGASFGAITAFLWVRYSRTAALGLGLVFLSVVTGIRFAVLLKQSDGSDGPEARGDWVQQPTNLLRQLRKEGHYTVTAFTVVAANVYVVLHVS